MLNHVRYNELINQAIVAVTRPETLRISTCNTLNYNDSEQIRRFVVP